MHYALARGASEIVLVGWSLGGSLALLVAENAALRRHLSALILIAPALSWKMIIRRAAVTARLPRLTADIAMAALGSRIACKLMRLKEPIDFKALDWLEAAPVAHTLPPTLVLHSRRDPLIPFELSQRFIQRQPGAELVAFDSLGHCTEYNGDRERFNSAVSNWLTSRCNKVMPYSK